MGQPFVGEIRMFAGNFAPAGWMFCSGQLLPISAYETLFNLIGTTYGGDGQSTFALPDMQGRVPIHMGTFAGQTSTLAQKTGVESVALTQLQIPPHSHQVLATSGTPVTSPANALPAVANSPGQPGVMVYGQASPAGTSLHPNTIQSAGNSLPHDNMQPFLCLSFIISLFGIFPTTT